MTVTSSGDDLSAGGSPYGPASFQPISGPDGLPPSEPVQQGGGINTRWVVAGLATLLVVIGIVIAVILFTGQRPGGVANLSEYAPENSAAYAELRLDLPGDQRDKVVEFMSLFPGFADPSTFEQKISDSLDNILRTTGAGITWSQDIDPWFGGQIAVFGSVGGEAGGTPSFTAVLSVKDRTRLDELVAERGGASGHYYRDIPIWTAASGNGAFTVTDDAFIIGARAEDVHAALDVKAGAAPNLAANADFTGSMATLNADRLGAAYIDGDALGTALDSLARLGTGGQVQDQTVPLPDKIMLELRAEDDSLSMTMRSVPRPDTTPQITWTNAPTTLADRMPADSVVYFGTHQTGAAIKQGVERLLNLYGPVIGGDSGTGPLHDMEEFLGMPPADFLDFLDETSVAITSNGQGGYGGGLIGTVTDEATAAQRMERLTSGIRAAIAFGQTDVPLTIEEVPHGAATLTVFHFQQTEGMDAPFSSISYTISDGRLLLGIDDFVAEALDRDPATSLAAQPRFKAALEAGGTDNASVVYVDLTGARVAIENLIPAEQRGVYDQEIKPFVAPFSRLIMVTSMDGNDTVGRFIVFVE